MYRCQFDKWLMKLLRCPSFLVSLCWYYKMFWGSISSVWRDSYLVFIWKLWELCNNSAKHHYHGLIHLSKAIFHFRKRLLFVLLFFFFLFYFLHCRVGIAFPECGVGMCALCIPCIGRLRFVKREMNNWVRNNC